jgi:hypothetical protein
MCLLFAIFFDTPLILQVTVQNVSNLIIPEDVELRLVSTSRGVARSTETMHTCVPMFWSLLRTSAVLQPVGYHAHFLVFLFMAGLVAQSNRCSPGNLSREFLF